MHDNAEGGNGPNDALGVLWAQVSVSALFFILFFAKLCFMTCIGCNLQLTRQAGK
jgi:hypothetical protein